MKSECTEFLTFEASIAGTENYSKKYPAKRHWSKSALLKDSGGFPALIHSPLQIYESAFSLYVHMHVLSDRPYAQ